MKDDVRYSEFLFLHELQKNPLTYFNPNDPKKQDEFGLDQTMLIEMIVALAEDLYVKFENHNLDLLVGKLRKEVANPPSGIHPHQWDNPRTALFDKYLGGQAIQLRITYRGMRRIEELRELLKRDRIFEPFGVMLDLRYFHNDFQEALQRPADVPVSILRFDMDSFKKINDDFGHPAGDVVMKSYLERVRDCIGMVGSSYRGRGDEVVALIVGREHKRVVEIAEKIRQDIETMRCKFNDIMLPPVTVSIGVATAPPDLRGNDLERLADERQSRAKKEGKNRVIAG